jgi:hypothetical protein
MSVSPRMALSSMLAQLSLGACQRKRGTSGCRRHRQRRPRSPTQQQYARATTHARALFEWPCRAGARAAGENAAAPHNPVRAPGLYLLYVPAGHRRTTARRPHAGLAWGWTFLFFNHSTASAGIVPVTSIA